MSLTSKETTLEGGVSLFLFKAVFYTNKQETRNASTEMSLTERGVLALLSLPSLYPYAPSFPQSRMWSHRGLHASTRGSLHARWELVSSVAGCEGLTAPRPGSIFPVRSPIV